MRFYRIEFARADGTPFYLRSLNGQVLTSLAPNGRFNPGALQVELNIPLYPQHAASPGAAIKVFGIGLQDIQRQQDFNDLTIKVYGGMSKGLPLATPNQAGLLMQGTIYQAYGNWVGVEQSLAFFCQGPIGTSDAPLNVPFTWQAGTPLASAIRSTLQIATPTLRPVINISPNLKL